MPLQCSRGRRNQPSMSAQEKPERKIMLCCRKLVVGDSTVQIEYCSAAYAMTLINQSQKTNTNNYAQRLNILHLTDFLKSINILHVRQFPPGTTRRKMQMSIDEAV